MPINFRIIEMQMLEKGRKIRLPFIPNNGSILITFFIVILPLH